MRLCIDVLAFCVVALPSVAQIRVHGSASERATGQALRWVRIDLRKPAGESPSETLPTWTDSLGRYAMYDIPAGRWSVQATYRDAPTAHVLKTTEFEIGPGDLALHFEFDLPRIPRDRIGMRIVAREARADGQMRLSGTVVDGITGTAVRGVRIHLLENPPQAASGQRLVRDSTTSDEHGNFLFSKRTPARYVLRFASEEHLSISSEPEYLAGTVGVLVRIPPRNEEPSGRGRIVDGSGRPLSQIQSAREPMTDGVIVGRVLDGGRGAESVLVELVGAPNSPVRTNLDGYFEIDRIKPGMYSIRVTMGGSVIEYAGLEVRVGGNEVTLDL